MVTSVPIRVRSVETTHDVEQFVQAIMRPFFATDSESERVALNDRFREEGTRFYLAEVDNVVAGTFGSFDCAMSMPGGHDVDVDAITAVTVLGTHRRRGVLTEMMRVDLDAAHERSQAAAILFAAEYPIYGRFGFGVANRPDSFTIDKHTTAFARPESPASASGSVRYATPQELLAIAPPLLDLTRAQRGGDITRTPTKWDIECGVISWPGRTWKGWQAISTDANAAPDGYARWTVEERWERGVPVSTLNVEALQAATSAAHERLWRFLFGLDLTATIKAIEIPNDDPLPWMLSNGRALVAERDSDGLWLRVLDPLAMLNARSLRDGAVDVAITDNLGYAEGVFRVEAGNVKRLRRRTSDLTMSVATFSSIILGGERADVLMRAGMIDEHRAGSATSLSNILAVDSAPFTSMHF